MDFNTEARHYGAKLCMMQARAIGETKLAAQIIESRAMKACQTGLRVCKPLWMSLFTAKTGKMLPNGNRDFYYIPFWKPRPKIYRFKLGVSDVNAMYPDSIYASNDKGTKWSIHSF